MTHFLKKLSAFSSIGLLAACAHHSSAPAPAPAPKSAPAEKKIGMANPASSYCVAQKGQLEMRKDSQGNVTGYCHLQNGKVVEEWDFFRKNHPTPKK